MAYHPSQIAWDKENTLKAQIKINRNQDPELYEMLSKTDNKAGLIRELVYIGLAAKKAQDSENQNV